MKYEIDEAVLAAIRESLNAVADRLRRTAESLAPAARHTLLNTTLQLRDIETRLLSPGMMVLEPTTPQKNKGVDDPLVEGRKSLKARALAAGAEESAVRGKSVLELRKLAPPKQVPEAPPPPKPIKKLLILKKKPLTF